MFKARDIYKSIFQAHKLDQVVETLPSKHKALSSTSRTTKKVLILVICKAFIWICFWLPKEIISSYSPYTQDSTQSRKKEWNVTIYHCDRENGIGFPTKADLVSKLLLWILDVNLDKLFLLSGSQFLYL
jgi:hypothetical protein